MLTQFKRTGRKMDTNGCAPIAERFAVRRPSALVRALARRPDRDCVSDERRVKVVARTFGSVAI